MNEWEEEKKMKVWKNLGAASIMSRPPHVRRRKKNMNTNFMKKWQ
jgi:hypothetical protein